MNWLSKPGLVAVRLDGKPGAAEFEALLPFVSSEKREAIGNYYREEDKLRSLVGELLVRMILIQRCGMTNAAIRFVYSSTGKPMLAGAEDLHFNVAHAGDWVVCAFDSQPVGVDVERIKPVNLSVSRSFFTEAEHLDICNASDPNARFFDYWTLKESFIKHSGKGLSQGLNSFEIVFLENGEIRIEQEGKLLENCFLKQYFLEEGYKLAGCGEGRLPDEVQYLNADDVIRFFTVS